MINLTLKLKSTVFVVIAALVLVSFSSCTPKYDEEVVISEAQRLIEASLEMNKIFFGEGLPYDQSEADEILKEIEGKEYDIDASLSRYIAVSEDSPYKSEWELRELIREIYSEEYAKVIEKRGFEGYDAGVYARYLEDEGTLKINIKDAREGNKSVRTYDYSTLTIAKMKRGYVIVKVLSLLDGVESDILEIKIVLEENGWRLDTPTY